MTATDSGGQPLVPLRGSGGELGERGAYPASQPAAGAARAGAVSPRLLLRHTWLMLGVALVALVAAEAVIWLALPANYKAAAVVEIYSFTPRYLIETDESNSRGGYEQYVATQADIMCSPPVLQRVLERADVRATAWYTQKPALFDRLLAREPRAQERLAEALAVAPRKKRELVDIVASAREPQDAATLANAVLDEYLDFARERFSQDDRLLYDNLVRDLAKLDADIAYAEQSAADVRRQLLTPEPDALISQRRVRLDALEGERDRLRMDLELARQQLLLLEPQPTSQGAGDGPRLARPNYEDDAEWRDLRAKLRDAQQRVVQASEQYGERHPSMLQFAAAVTDLEQQLAAWERHLDEVVAGGGTIGQLRGTLAGDTAPQATTPEALRARIRLLEAQQQQLEVRAAQLRSEFEGDFKFAESLRRNTGDLALLKEKQAAVKLRLQEIEEKGRVPASIRTIAKASPPTSPDNDKRLKLAIAAIFGALAAGVGAGFLLVKYNPRVQTIADVGAAADGAFVGYVPLEPGVARRLADVPRFAEAVRVVRTALLNQLDGHGAVLQLTSAGPGSGKSTLCAALGRSLANCGKKVLLVDADVQRPKLTAQFAADDGPGLMELLANGTEHAEAIRATAAPGLDVLPAGGLRGARELDLLANGKFSGLLAQWRGAYDVVLLDGPPLLHSADAAILSRHADGSLLVVRERHCHRAALVGALAALGAAGGRLLGTVFVGSDTAGMPYGYGYGYGYGAQRNDVIAQCDARLLDPPQT